MMWKMLGADHPMEALKIDSEAFTIEAGRQTQEGVTAFLEKREATFPNKVSTELPEFYPWWEELKFQ